MIGDIIADIDNAHMHIAIVYCQINVPVIFLVKNNGDAKFFILPMPGSNRGVAYLPKAAVLRSVRPRSWPAGCSPCCAGTACPRSGSRPHRHGEQTRLTRLSTSPPSRRPPATRPPGKDKSSFQSHFCQRMAGATLRDMPRCQKSSTLQYGPHSCRYFLPASFQS